MDPIKPVLNELIIEKLLTEVPIHIYWKNKSGQYLHMSNTQAKKFGVEDPKLAIGKTDFDLLDSTTATKIQENDLKILKLKKPTITEELVTINNQTETYWSYKAPICNEANEAIGIIGVSFDHTSKKHLENVNNSVLTALLEKYPGTVYWKDQNGVYLGCNMRQAQMHKLNHEQELIGKTDFDLNLTDPDTIWQNDKRVMTKRQALSIEEAVEIDGKKMYFLSHKIPLVENDICTGLIGISLDITELKEAEELKKELEFQKRANEMLKLWSSAIAHEMRTPLLSLKMAIGAMASNIEMCLKMPQVEELPALKSKLKTIAKLPKGMEKTITQANHFIDMTLVKSRSGMNVSFDLVPLSIGDEVTHAIETYPFHEGDDALLNLNLENNFTFMGDSDAFHHILYNLLKNAIQYVKKVDDGKIFISFENQENQNKLIFKDTGPGISAEHVPELFKPFFSKSKHGTGVGLSLCKNFMTAFGGDITCNSVVGEFTQFELLFPGYQH